MAIFHRKLLVEEPETAVNSTCTSPCQHPSYGYNYVSPPLPSFPADIDQPESHGSRSVSPVFVIMFCALAAAFSVIFCLTLSKRRRESPLRNSLRRNGGDDGTVTHQEFMDEDRGSPGGVFHPIWLINSIGLDQSVIDSINAVKYRKDEGLIEGTDCSVCLTEFEDDESLRLLPKCNHAFHVPCIDTWLRSHKNCPLCRAPIVKEANTAQMNTNESNSNELSSIREDNPMENNESGDRVAGDNGHGEMRGDELPNVVGEKIAEILRRSSRNLNAGGNGGIQILGDLGDHHAKRGEELEATRMSFSVDLSSLPIMEHEGGSDTQLAVEANKPNLQKVAKGHKRSSSNMYKKVMKSSSFGISSQKGPISMKRSYSSTGKWPSESRQSKSRDSILPL